MWTIIELAMIDTMPLQNMGSSAIHFAEVLISVTIRQEVTLLADNCRAFFLDIELLAADAKAILSAAM